MYEQLIYPNLSVETNAGWCLWEVQEIYGVQHLYRSAWEAWQSAKLKHEIREMPNVSVPCYFEHWGTYGTPPTYDNWGHIVAYVPNVGFVSSPMNGFGQDIFQTLEEIERNFNCKFVGWSEDLSGELIIKEKTVDKKASYEFCANASQFLLGRPTPVTIDWYNSSAEKDMTESQVYNSWANSQEAKDFRWKGWDYGRLLNENEELKQKSDFIKVSDLYIKK